MKLLRVLLVLVFGLAMAGPEAHECPVHDQHAPAHHQPGGEHQQQPTHTLCTCPQACTPATAAIAEPEAPAAWIVASATIRVALGETFSAPALTPNKHLQPPALAPPAPIKLV